MRHRYEALVRASHGRRYAPESERRVLRVFVCARCKPIFLQKLAEGAKKTITYLRSAFPDFKITIDEVAVSGDKIWARQRGGGTNSGRFAGHAPTGRIAFTEVIDICRIENGKIVEHWGVPDQLGMMLQLGLIAPPVRHAEVTA